MQCKKKLFFTSDWHLFHHNVIEFSNRPFKDIDEMSQSLIKRYNATVPEDGICYFLGDMGSGNAQKHKEIIDQLNGTKVLILGNHDSNYDKMYDSGYDVVINSARLFIANELVTLSHCPLIGVFREDTTGMRHSTPGEMWHREFDHSLKYSVPNEGQFHLHGHLHSPNNGISERELGRQYDVGVDANNYAPVSAKKITQFIIRTKKREN